MKNSKDKSIIAMLERAAFNATLIPFVFGEGGSSVQLLLYPKRKESGVLLRKNRDQFRQFIGWKAQSLFKWLNSFNERRVGNDICIKVHIVSRTLETDTPRTQWLHSMEKFPESVSLWMREVEFALSDYGRMRIDGDVDFQITFQGEPK